MSETGWAPNLPLLLPDSILIFCFWGYESFLLKWPSTTSNRRVTLYTQSNLYTSAFLCFSVWHNYSLAMAHAFIPIQKVPNALVVGMHVILSKSLLVVLYRGISILHQILSCMWKNPVMEISRSSLDSSPRITYLKIHHAN